MNVSRISAVATAVVVASAGAVIVLGGETPPTVHAAFPSAINVVTGAEVRAGGVKVGEVKDIELRGARADLQLEIADERLWPLRRGTTASIRLGGNASYANRYVEVVPAAGTAPALPAGGRLVTRDATSPVEFDELFNVFDSTTRAGLGQLIDTSADTFGGRGTQVADGLRTAGPAFTEARGTFEALSDDPYALRALVRSTGAVASRLATHEGRLRALVTDAATTLSAAARSDDDLRATLRGLPRTLQNARGTLARTDRSLAGVDGLVRGIRPGAAELRRTALPLRQAVARLATVAPDLRATLARIRSDGGTIARFLTDAVPQLTRLRPVLARVAPMVGCLRSYVPEIAATFSTWASFTTGADANGRYAWLNPQAMPFPNTESRNSADIATAFPALRYAFIRPPGLNVGEPALDPACGADGAGLDPEQDPEAR